MAQDENSEEFDDEWDDSSFFSKKERKTRIITEEERIMTKEEREERNNNRLAMSRKCFNEVWSLYRKLNLGNYRQVSRPLSGLYDPDVDKKKAFLGKRFQYMLDGLQRFKESPSIPYLRHQWARDLDVEGRRLLQPPCVRVQMPEIDYDYSLPLKPSAKGVTLKVFHASFVDNECMKDVECQTWRRDALEKSRKWSRKKEWVSARPEIPLEEFDIDEIPIDEDGNPVGKSTGLCEWCKHEILPVPSYHKLYTTWDKARLYCCTDYMNFINEAEAFEKAEKERIEKENRLIDIRPNKGKKIKKEELSQSVVSSPSDEKRIRRKKEKKEHAVKMRQVELLKKIDEETDRKKKLQEKGPTKHRNQSISTHDLPWDPYESRFGHPKFFNDQIFDDPGLHSYPHYDVIDSQSGTYSHQEVNQEFIMSGEQSKKNSDKGSKDGSRNGSKEESPRGSKEGSGKISKKWSRKGPREESIKGSKEDSGRGSKEGSKKGSKEEPIKGSKEGSIKGSKEGSRKGSVDKLKD